MVRRSETTGRLVKPREDLAAEGRGTRRKADRDTRPLTADDDVALAAIEKAAATVAIKAAASLARAGDIDHLGGGLDLICACDVRLASKDASVSLRETKVAIVADMGSLNRLPFIVGDGHTRLMAFTGRDFSGEECKAMGLFSEVYESQDKMMTAARDLAREIASNPSIILRGVKQNLNFQNGKSTLEGMDYVTTYNAAFLDTAALREMMTAFKERRRPVFD